MTIRQSAQSSDDGLFTASPLAMAQSQKKILYFDHTAALGGGEIALFHLVQELDRQRYTPVVLLGAEGPLADRLRDSAVQVYVMPLSASIARAPKDSLGLRSLTRVKDAWLTAVYVLKLARFIRAQHADLVHTNSLKADILGALAARMARVPVLWHVRDRIDEDYLPRPVVRLFRWLCRWMPQYVVANSNATMGTIRPRRSDRCAAIHSGVLADERAHVVYDGVFDHHSGAGEPVDPARAPLIGLVGRISPWKGQHIFLQAAARVRRHFPNARFQIIGSVLFDEQEYEKEIRAVCTGLGLDDCVEFTGFRNDVPDLIDRLDILVHASTTGEPFGQVVAEGMAAGKPVVATAGGGVPEVVVDGVTGLLAPMGNALAMANAIVWFLDHPAEAREMGQRARERILTHFTVELTARKMSLVYEEIWRQHRIRHDNHPV